jgi:hypothetical protein
MVPFSEETPHIAAVLDVFEVSLYYSFFVISFLLSPQEVEIISRKYPPALLRFQLSRELSFLLMSSIVVSVLGPCCPFLSGRSFPILYLSVFPIPFQSFSVPLQSFLFLFSTFHFLSSYFRSFPALSFPILFSPVFLVLSFLPNR